MKDNNDESITYDVVVIGGGLSGITTAYMLRDKNILLLEKENRFGGRVESEQIFETTNNIGTQYFTDSDSSLTNLMNELGIQRVSHDPRDVPYALYVDGQYYPSMKLFMTMGVQFDRLRILARLLPRMMTFLKPEDHPKRRELIRQSIQSLQDGLNPKTKSLINAYMRGACLAKPENTSAGIGAMLMPEVFSMGEFAFVTGGFQKVTDGMLTKVGDKVLKGVEVTRIEERDGRIHIHFTEDCRERVITSRSAVVTVPAPVVPRLIPDLPPWKRDALELVKYGPITMVSVIFRKVVPWDRFFALVSDDSIFQMMIDQTMDTEDDRNPNNPVVCNFVISKYPDETGEIKEFLALSDEEIIQKTLSDFRRIVPVSSSIDECILDTKVTRYPLGEIELSPEYYSELLPRLSKPVGNIHFAGDYTHWASFVDGTVYSAFKVARALGSKFVVSEEDEYFIKFSSLLFR